MGFILDIIKGTEKIIECVICIPVFILCLPCMCCYAVALERDPDQLSKKHQEMFDKQNFNFNPK